MLKNVAVALGLRVAGTALWLLLSVVIARTLATQDFGLVFLVVDISLTGGVIVALGYDQTVLRYGARYWKDLDVASLAHLVVEARCAVSLAGAGVGVLSLLAYVAGVETPVTKTLAITCLTAALIYGTGVLMVSRDVLRVANRLSDALLGMAVVRTLVSVILVGLATALGILTAELGLLCYAGGLVAAVVWSAYRVKKLNLPLARRTDRRRWKHLPTALFIWPGEAALVGFGRAAGISIGLTGNLNAAAMFLAAQRIAQLGTFLTDAVTTSVAPMLASSSIQDRQDAATRASMMMLASGVTGSCALALLGRPMLALFGDQYSETYPVLLALLLGQLSWTVLGPTALIMNMMGRERLRSVVSIVSTILLLLGLAFCETALQAAFVFAAMSWVLNLSCWFAIWKTLGLHAGVTGMRAAAFREAPAKMHALLSRFASSR